MALGLLETEEGQKWLTRAGIAGMAAAAHSAIHRLLIDDERWPLYVRYEAGRTVFVPREEIYLRDPTGPTDCQWIVPGSMSRF